MTRDDFEARVSSNRKKLMHIARGMLPAGDCEDAVQSAVLSAWEHLDQLRDEDAFDGWLRQILINHCRALYRSKKKNEDVFSALAAAQSISPPGTQETIGLNEALDKLPKKERNLLLMHHDQGYSLSEMSEKLGQSEDVLKMRLYRARKRLRIALISLLLLLLLLTAAAVGTGYLDVNWFLMNRRASKPALYKTDRRFGYSISYDGLLLSVEISDAVWDMEKLSLLITYSLTGTDDSVLTVHSSSIGVDGEQFDHIWVDDQILPVEQWADGKPVHTFYLDGWMMDGSSLRSSEDYVPDGYGETFFAEFRFDQITPKQYGVLLDADGRITLACRVLVRDHATNEILEEGMLTVRVSAPELMAWRNAYEAYFD